MDAALTLGAHYCDLGGLFHVTRQQLRRHAEFKRARAAGTLRHRVGARHRERDGAAGGSIGSTASTRSTSPSGPGTDTATRGRHCSNVVFDADGPG